MSSAICFNLDQSKILSFGNRKIKGVKFSKIESNTSFDWLKQIFLSQTKMFMGCLNIVRLIPRKKMWPASKMTHIINSLPQSRLLRTLNEKTFENIVGKGENSGNQHFSPFRKQILVFLTLILSSVYDFYLDQSKILFGKELSLSHLTKFYTSPN